MSIKQQIRSRLRRGPVFECVGCGQTFEDERLSCPACGWCLRKTK
jgi:rRNA maturation endonuclease Nob1